MLNEGKLLKICLVTNIYPPAYLGGPGEVVYNLQKYFLKQGHQAYVLTCSPNSNQYPFTIRTPGGKRNFPLLSPFYYFKEARKIGFDILNIHLEVGMGIAPFLRFHERPKIVTTLHTEYLTESKATEAIVTKDSVVARPSLEEWIIKRFSIPIKTFGTYLDISVSDSVVSVSGKTRDDYLRQGYLSKDRISVVYNGVDVEKFNPRVSGESIRARYSIGDAPLMLCVGGGVILKGAAFAILAMSKIAKVVPNAKLMLVGIEEKFKPGLDSLINSLELSSKVVIVPRIPNDQLPSFYAASDIVVLPSLSENFPIVMLEAMSSGKPLVASRVGGIPEAIQDKKNGFLVQPGNAEQMADTLIYLLTHPSAREEVGCAARMTVEENFDWPIIGQKYVDEFTRLIENKKP